MTAIAHYLKAPQRPAWWKWLVRELVPFPGRDITVLRIVIAVVMTTIISMALQVPQLFFSAFFVFFVSKENRVVTTITGVLMLIGVTCAMGISLLLFQFTFEYPELRIPIMATAIFTGMFLSRVFFIGPLGFVVGFFTALMQTLTDTSPNADVLVRSALWLWVAVVYPIGLTVLINQVLLPAHPWDAMVRGVTSRLEMTSGVLRRILKQGVAGGRPNPELMELTSRGTAGLHVLLNLAESQEPSVKERHVSYTALLGATEHLTTATMALEFREPPVAITTNDRSCIEILLVELERLKNMYCYPNLAPNRAERLTPDQSQLREVQLAVEAFHDGLIKRTPADSTLSAKAPKKHLFVQDAFTNPSYIYFALKVTLSAMICYLIYTGLKWPGITTSFITCCFIALENTGATMRKGWLRIIGCCFGGLLGFLAIMYLIPQMESITSLVFLTAAASIVMAWISTGSERIAYAGLQGAFAFYLCIFQGYAPEVNFTSIRDRIVGILLGITVSTIVFHYIWPEHAIDRLRTTVAMTWRSLAQVLKLPHLGKVDEPERQEVDKLRVQIRRKLDDSLRLSELAMFEYAGKEQLPTFEKIVANTQALVLMTGVLFDRVKMEEWEQLETPVQAAEIKLREQSARKLIEMADLLERQGRAKVDDLGPAYAAWNQNIKPENHNDRVRLVRRVVERLNILADDVSHR